MSEQVCSVCGSPVTGDFGGSRGDTYATFTCEHGPTSDYDYDRGTGRPGADTVDSAQFNARARPLFPRGVPGRDPLVERLEAQVALLELEVKEIKQKLESKRKR